MKKWRVAVAAALLAVLLGGLLGGCVPLIKAQFELKIGLNEKWDFVTTLLVSPEVADSAFQGLNQQFSNASQLEKQGVKVNFEKLAPDADGNIPLRMSASGTGYDTLNTFLGQPVITVQEIDGLRALNFHLNLGLTTAQQTEFTLRAGRVLSHNGVLLDDNTAQWVNFNGEMQAATQEPGWLDYAPWILLGLGTFIFLALIAFLLFFLRPRRKTATPARKKCSQCAAIIPSHATFCPMCGAKQN
ncbi:MAG: hypothetical protein OHK0031_10280 [Anaerolineales bacterium]